MPREQAYADTSSADDEAAATVDEFSTESLVPLPGTLTPLGSDTMQSAHPRSSYPRVLTRTDTKAQVSLYDTLGKSELLTSGPTRALHVVWSELDEDGSGSLSKNEFDTLNKKLAVKWDGTKAWGNAILIQTMQDTDAQFQWKSACLKSEDGKAPPKPRLLAAEEQKEEISFRVFVSVYNQMMGTIRRHARRDIKAIFETCMQDPRGLQLSELDRFIRRVEKHLFLLAPRYNLKADLELLAELSGIKNVEEGIYFDFPTFERWWKYRVGLLEADTPVVPEL
eukprot:COSAG02_NODE_7279_length_3086_cov_3.513559_1_plen_281_part_00